MQRVPLLGLVAQPHHRFFNMLDQQTLNDAERRAVVEYVVAVVELATPPIHEESLDDEFLWRCLLVAAVKFRVLKGIWPNYTYSRCMIGEWIEIHDDVYSMFTRPMFLAYAP